ncbi:unnamed protein product [Soboliphyme baturini]|uniref:Uncharacterized protein n=1 Tax=Soboliphyme baturini TaxID=241478 RepID=A0A183IP16_9BILA|nr:unnamed protein product [Soboliphyme baturini]
MVPSQETVAPQQHVSFLQAYGFGGLWRFARPFLHKASLGQMLSPEACTCLERLIGNLGEVPPLTPPPLSPHVGGFPAMFSDLQPEESS